MGLKVKINGGAALEVLKGAGVLELAGLETALAEHRSGQASLWQVVLKVVLAIQWARISAGLGAEEAARIAAEAVDALLEFSGTAWGVLPVGAAVESADGPVIGLVVKLAYEAIRGRDILDREAFQDLVKLKVQTTG